jgi:hypothetical protein
VQRQAVRLQFSIESLISPSYVNALPLVESPKALDHQCRCGRTLIPKCRQLPLDAFEIERRRTHELRSSQRVAELFATGQGTNGLELCPLDGQTIAQRANIAPHVGMRFGEPGEDTADRTVGHEVLDERARHDRLVLVPTQK